MDLIKQILVELQKAKLVKAAETDEMAKAELVAKELGLTESKANPKSDMSRIASYWKTHGQKKSSAELRDAVGNDLEQIEYSPAEVSKMVPQILKMIAKE